MNAWKTAGASIALGLSLLAGAQPALGAEPRDGQRDFDFLVGSWTVKNRRLAKALSGSSTWHEFPGTLVARRLGDGRTILDELVVDTPSGRVQGLTLTLYDPRARQWSQHWSNSANGTLDRPLIGSFQDGRGELYDQETYEGRSILARNVWSDITPTSVRWEQAFSADGGKTWEVNWTMELTRVP